MNLAECAREANRELSRLGVLYDRRANPDGLVCRPETGRNPPALRMGCEWFHAVYSAEHLLYYLRELRLAPAAKSLTGVTMWRSPLDGALRIEKEAFAWLDRQDAQQARTREKP